MSHVVEAATAGIGHSYPAAGALRSLPGGPSSPDLRIEVPFEQVTFSQARTPAQLRRIAHLRDAIALPAAVREAPAFARLEKKETSWVS
jgi:hypothetical protein